MRQEIIRIDLNSVNCYLGKSEEGFVLFDTGGPITMDKGYSNRRSELEAQLEKAGCRPGNLKAIIITHGDMDHVANASYLRDRFKTVIAMHREDVNLVEDLTLDKMMESFHYNNILLKLIFFIMKKPIRRINEKVLKDFTKFSPDILLENEDDLSQFGFHAKVIHLPGHTAGSIGFSTEEGEFICGDTLANMKKPAPAMNAYDFKLLKSSINKIKSMKITMIYPGHGNPFAADTLKI